MRALRWLSVPLLVLSCTTGLVLWAFPDGLSPARTAGVVIGWIGCGLLLCSLLLMVREPRLAALLGGLQRLYDWHHWTGFAAYVALLAHPLALAADAGPGAPQLAWQTLSPFSESWPVWSGWLSLLLLMAGLAATFERRLPYRTRRWLHIALGIGVLLGMAHLVLLGVDEPIELLIALAVLLLMWRAVRSDWGFGARPYVVKSAHPVADGTIEIVLAPLADLIDVVPGQFIQIAFLAGPGFQGCGEFHPFTVCGMERDGQIRIAVKSAGDCTCAIQSMRPGTAARVQGAFGTLFAEQRPGSALWVAGGVGVTPFVAMLRSHRLAGPTMLLYLYRSPADAAFLNELQALEQAEPLFSLHAVATGAAAPDLTTLLPDAKWLADRECYVAGPPGLIAGVKSVLRNRGVAWRRFHCENLQGL